MNIIKHVCGHIGFIFSPAINIKIDQEGTIWEQIKYTYTR